MKPFLILQLRPESKAADEEFASILRASGLTSKDVRRYRIEEKGVPNINLDDFSGVIVGGGPACISSKDKKPAEKRFEKQLLEMMDEISERDFPYLGACYGLSILAVYLGGIVSTEKYAETVAATTLSLTKDALNDPIMHDFPAEFRAVGGHKESCQNLPAGSVLLVSSEACPVHMIRYKNNIYATQFHPELDGNATATRIRVYKDYGYFEPEEADKLIANVMKESLEVPGQILKKFVNRYQTVAP